MAYSRPSLSAIKPYLRLQYDYDAAELSKVVADLFSTNCVHHLCAPFGTLHGDGKLLENAILPLAHAFDGFERRDYILISGVDDLGQTWVGAGGYYTGNFAAPFLDIPPSFRQATLRFHEFYRFEGNQIVETQVIWDLPALMISNNVWPMAPSLGLDWQVPAPATLDGVDPHSLGEAHDRESKKLILDMLGAMIRHPQQGGPELMEMPRYWHKKMNWYGPGGIGTARGIKGFRDFHQIPFLAAMPDRGQDASGTQSFFFAQGDYVAVTGWPNMNQTLSGGGWLGLPPTGEKILLRSLDFWRIEDGKIRENWVLVDLIDMFGQLGVDVFSRLREFNKTRAGFDPQTGAQNHV